MSGSTYDNIASFWPQPAAPVAAAPLSMSAPASDYASIYGLGQQPAATWTAQTGPMFPNTSSAGSGFMDWLNKDGNLATSIQGLQALTGTYLGLKNLRQAQDALNFQKKAYGTNLANSVKTYNTSLEDRINGRTANYAGKEGDVQNYLREHQLKSTGI